MRKEMTSDERILMIEEMIERGEVYHGYRANKYPSTLPEPKKSNVKAGGIKGRRMADVPQAELMEILKEYPEKGLTTIAKELNINLGSLRYRMKKLGIIC